MSKSSLRQQAIEALVASGPSGIRGNQPGILTVTYSVAEAVLLVLREAGVFLEESANLKSTPFAHCECRKTHRNANIQLRLCKPHRALVARLFKSAGFYITLRTQKRKRRSRKRTGDLYRAGLIVGGGLPSLGKRR